MQNSLQNRLPFFCTAIYLFFLFLTPGLGSQIPSSSYSSLLGGIETGKADKKTVYNFYQIMNLRKALAPRWVQVLNQKEYARTGKMLQKGLLFTYEGRGRQVKNVSLAGTFSNWSEIPMQRNRMGIFFHILSLNSEDLEEGAVYRYKFAADGVWMHDPQNVNRTNDGMGGYYSVFHRNEARINRKASVRVIEGGKECSPSCLVEFSVYLPKVKSLSLVGSFNNWNPEHDFMVPDKNGIFRCRIRLGPGAYIYKYIADGKWILDKYNQNTRFAPSLQELASFLKLP